MTRSLIKMVHPLRKISLYLPLPCQ
jgi:hypothetical protein